MAEISIADAKMMYQESLILRKGIPVFIRHINEEGMVHAWNLVSQKFLRFRFKQSDLAPPSFRLGYINLGTNCFYLNRVPSRVYKVGISSQNLSRKRTDHPLLRAEEMEARAIMSTLSSVSLYKTIKGVYPSLQEAYRNAKDNSGCVAFDRQFAVDASGFIYFKGTHVGKYLGEDISFDRPYSYLVNNLPKGLKK